MRPSDDCAKRHGYAKHHACLHFAVQNATIEKAFLKRKHKHWWYAYIVATRLMLYILPNKMDQFVYFYFMA